MGCCSLSKPIVSDEIAQTDYFDEIEEITDNRLLEPGDFLSRIGKICSRMRVYYHHGIFLGPGNGVAEIGIEPTCSGARIELINPQIVGLDEFISNDTLYRVKYRPGMCLEPSQTIDMAKFYVENPDEWDRYRLLLNNCEHFATKCKTGKAISKQVTDFLKSLMAARSP